jgi:DNA-binding transcriptional ArsR family regulator
MLPTAKRSGHPGISAVVFAALGDKTRLALVAKLASGQAYSISQLAKGSRVTRQAVRKHLRVLEKAGMVHGVRHGREHRFAFDPGPVRDVRQYLDFVSEQWDQALGRLQAFVERE